MTLTNKQKRFVDEYMIDGNGKQAAIRAGYSEKTAEQTASRMLRFVKVKEAIQKAQNKLADKHEITKDKIINELSKIAFSEVGNPDEDNTKIKVGDKIKALMETAKLCGFVTDKQEITGADGGAIETVTTIEIVAAKMNNNDDGKD